MKRIFILIILIIFSFAVKPVTAYSADIYEMDSEINQQLDDILEDYGIDYSAENLENISLSQMFNIIKEYNSGEMDLYHMDVYRTEGDTSGLGLDEYLKKDGVVIIEWADMIESELPEERLEIKFKITGEEKRSITITPYGSKYEDLCEDVL